MIKSVDGKKYKLFSDLQRKLIYYSYLIYIGLFLASCIFIEGNSHLKIVSASLMIVTLPLLIIDSNRETNYSFAIQEEFIKNKVWFEAKLKRNKNTTK